MAMLHLVQGDATEPGSWPDGVVAEALRTAAGLLGPTTRATLARRAGSVLRGADPDRVAGLLRLLKSLGDLSGEARGAAVAPAPLRAFRLSGPGEAVPLFLLAGGPRTAALRLPAHVATPFLRVARLMAADEEAFCARVQALGGLVLPWRAWDAGRAPVLDGTFLGQQRLVLEPRASDQVSPRHEDLRLCRPGAGPADRPTRWTAPRKSETGWFLARQERRFYWTLVEGGQAVRATALPFGEAAALQFALEREARTPRTMQVQLIGPEGARLAVPSPLPREEWRLVRAMAREGTGRDWSLAAPDALWLAQVLPERLGVRVEHLPGA